MMEQRKLIHEILDLVLDINSLEERCTAGQPTAFFSFEGHVGLVMVRVFPGGWVLGENSAYEGLRADASSVEKLKEMKEKICGR